MFLESDEELDFMSEMQASLQRKPKKGEEGSDEEIDDEGGDDDDDVPAGDGEYFLNLIFFKNNSYLNISVIIIGLKKSKYLLLVLMNINKHTFGLDC